MSSQCFASVWIGLSQLRTSGYCDSSTFVFAEVLELCRGDCERAALFKCSHKFSTGLRSGLWRGHFRTLMLLLLNHLWLYAWAQAWWKTNLLPSCSSCADSVFPASVFCSSRFYPLQYWIFQGLFWGTCPHLMLALMPRLCGWHTCHILTIS